MAVSDPCKAREPRVIDNDLIRQCIDYQYPKGKSRKEFNLFDVGKVICTRKTCVTSSGDVMQKSIES